jgi:hypothetical protein
MSPVEMTDFPIELNKPPVKLIMLTGNQGRLLIILQRSIGATLRLLISTQSLLISMKSLSITLDSLIGLIVKQSIRKR